MSDVTAIVGATASGKSVVAMELATKLGGEIVNADAMQLYAGLPILTNQPPWEDTSRIRHHLLGVWPLEQEGDVATYQLAAWRAIDDILARRRRVIIVGGTGLYMRAAVSRLDLPPAPPPGLRARIARRYDEDGPAATHALLTQRDARAAARIHPHDRRRVIRALELVELGATLAPASDRLFDADLRYPTRIIGLRLDRDRLRCRIEQRTRRMFAGGVIDEVRAARAQCTPSVTASRMLGWAEVTAVLDQQMSVVDAIERLCRRTMRYAHRQETWLRRIPELELRDAPATDPAAVPAASRVTDPEPAGNQRR